MTATQIGLTFAAVSLGSLAVMAWLAFRAPVGFQDERGWHSGEPDEHSNPDNLGV